MCAKTFSPKVCIIGAGFSGIWSAVKLQSELNLTSISVFDKNRKVGGVWATHFYPGCCTNIPAPTYCFTFEPKLDWTKALPEPNEIQNYAEFVCSKYNLWPHIQLETEVSQLAWNDNERNWTVSIMYLKNSEFRVEKQTFDLVFLGTGPLRFPNIPQEFSAFKGLCMHSAQWDPSVTVESLKDKNVGIVGTGDSGTQVVSALGSKVKSLHVYQRCATHLLPMKLFTWMHNLQPYLRRSTFLRSMYFWMIFLLYIIFHYSGKSGSWLGSFMAYIGQKHMHSIIPPEKSGLRETLTPKVEYFAKVPAPEFGYCKTFLLPNVTLHTDPIISVQADGVVTRAEGHEKKYQPLDVLILATGYKTDEYFGPLKIYGRHGKDILNSWKLDRPISYFGVLNSDMPNLFIIDGMTSMNAANFCIEVHVNFVVRLLKIMIRKNKRVVVVKPESEFAYQREIERTSSQMAYTKYKSHFVNSRGHPIVYSPVSPFYYYFKLRFVKASDFLFS